MVEFVMTIGVPASGKSTWARKRFKEDESNVWISSDSIRAKANYEISNQKVFEEMFEESVDLLNRGFNVIYDATNLSMKRRKNLISRIISRLENVVVWFRCEVFVQPREVLLERNAQREGKDRVPEEVIDRMISEFQFPQYFEGWDFININANSEGAQLNLNTMKGYDQKNKHHDLDLYAHTRASVDFARTMQFPLTIEEALWHHDYGKMWCQTFDEYGCAHYYGHQNISAYLFCLSVVYGQENYSKEDFLEIIFLINYHMRPYNWTQKAYGRDSDLFGFDYTRKLKMMHKCDTAAH